jgi:hypothetical protein
MMMITFYRPSKYEFSLAVYTTFDGGETWTERADLELPPKWQAAGTSDPALAWDVSQYTPGNKKDIVMETSGPVSKVEKEALFDL